MASRHRSRELAVQLCYQWDLDPKSLQDPRVTDRFWKNQAQSSADNWDFFEYLVKGVAEHLPYIDGIIEKVLANWKMERVEKVDLAVLRVAVFELVYSADKDRPDDAVILDEAVELAKVFGNQGAPSFVNGVLDAVAKNPQMRGGRGNLGLAPRSSVAPVSKPVGKVMPPPSTAPVYVAPTPLPSLHTSSSGGDSPRRVFKVPVRKGVSPAAATPPSPAVKKSGGAKE